jgi:hypothetical protein
MHASPQSCAVPPAAVASLLWVALTGCAGGLGAAQAVAAEEIQCPSSLRTTQAPTEDPATPWSASQQGQSSRLLYVEVYAGPWRQEQSLPPDEMQDSPGRQSLTWRLKGLPSVQGTWLVCTYQNTQVKLERRLPEAVTECLQVSSTDPKRVVKLLEHRCR